MRNASKPANPAKPPAVPVIPASQVSREKAWEYLSLTGRTDAMDKGYKARFVDAKGAKPIPEDIRKKHLAALNNMLITLVQKSFSPSAMDSVLVFLKTPGGERWAEDAADFSEEFRDESHELFSQFAEEIKDMNEDAADKAAEGVPSITPSAPMPSAPVVPATLPPKIPPTQGR
ncbi:MAG: hypothetical protein AAB250_09605 [Bdellovibrionota bacterium]